MERIQSLIDKLYQQKQLNSHPAHLLFTVQLLHAELLKFQQHNGTLGTKKVAVTLPTNMSFAEEEMVAPLPEPVAEEKEIFELQEIAEPEVPQIAEQPKYEPTEYRLRRPITTEQVMTSVVEEEVISPYAPKPQQTKPQHQVLNPAFSNAVETPTLVQHSAKKELHEVIAEKKESLNDRLKQEKTEIVEVLKETPVRDLKKAIGINDRFAFVSELFRGDEAMYERSIKTINNFHIFSEAEYWINRELKFKLGWNDSKETVQHFYHLVRRRFS